MSNGHVEANGARDEDRHVFFVDLDNTLYPKSYKIHDMMAELIDLYFVNELKLSPADARTLHERYYKDYGLALEGLVRFHKIGKGQHCAQVRCA